MFDRWCQISGWSCRGSLPTFSHTVWVALPFLMVVSLAAQKRFGFDAVSRVPLFLCFCCLRWCIREDSAAHNVWKYGAYISSQESYGFTGHIEVFWPFWTHSLVWCTSGFVFLRAAAQLSQRHLVKGLCLLHSMLSLPLLNSNWAPSFGSISGLPVLFHWWRGLFLCQHQAVSISVALWYKLLSRTVIAPTLSFVFRIAAAIRGLCLVP